MAPGALAQVLRQFENLFPLDKYPDLVVGLDVSDDAAVYRVGDDNAVIFTLDFFTPVVDDPYTYGAIAAVNAMSDIYAMGGRVVMALNICCWPAKLPLEILGEILRGGCDKVIEAGGILAGGHTIDDKEPKYGLAVFGFVHPDKVLSKQGVKPGDVLILTKPLGVGIITTALKGGAASDDHVDAAVESMLRLNKGAAEVMQDVGVNACTDITGFAFLGHAADMAAKSHVSFRFKVERIPFIPGAKEYAAGYLFPGGTCRNQEAFSGNVTFDSSIPDEMQQLLFTPETSGGLLIAVPKGKLDDLTSRFKKAKEDFWVVGEATEGSGVEVAP